jgi:Holliday junction resolvase RusA-like endonuclease
MYKDIVSLAFQEWLIDDDYHNDPKPPLIFIYTLYPESNRRMDVSNVCSVVDKFTCDALTELGIITDDNHKIIPAINYRFGKVDKENPRVELEIEEWR